ncbi:L-threonylcarbamoyladenylate synthase [Gottschalkiaceae bacterium SANA]|nr:L-threonylcarbamoyladenylate synthase [Gottschalkiaceae bacterium SANA]
MKTILFQIEENQQEYKWMKEAAKLIRNGSLVAFPTETVYGLGANALDPVAISKIYQAKGRPSDNPLIVHVANLSMVEELVTEVPFLARKAMKRFWPGPLTLVMPRSTKVPDCVTAGLDTVAIRMPAHPVALSLIDAAGVPIAAPSANRSGRPSPTRGQHVVEDLDGLIAGIIIGPESQFGVESTVLDVTGQVPEILRPGGVTREMLLEIYSEVRVDPALESVDAKQIPKSPGQKYRHYAPRAKMTVMQGSLSFKKECALAALTENSGKGVVLASDELAKLLPDQDVWNLGSYDCPEIAANRLFDLLRMCDARNIQWILAEGYEEEGLGAALMNRMRKAAGGQVIKEEER